jgi:type II secretory pathway pseudopilin PulG
MKKSGTKTSLFLIELIISLLLFAFCAAICMQIFVGAKFRTEDSSALSKSVFLASSAAELYKAYGGDMDKLREAYDPNHTSMSDGLLQVFYDEQWEETQKPTLDPRASRLAVYVLYVDAYDEDEAEVWVSTRPSGSMVPGSGYVPAEQPREVIYSIQVKAVDTNGQ